MENKSCLAKQKNKESLFFIKEINIKIKRILLNLGNGFGKKDGIK
jgi:hypothetical protein